MILSPQCRWLTATILCLALPCAAQDTARMDEAVQRYVTADQFSGSALVARGNEIVFAKSYGEANREWHIANTIDTKFRIGSVTKQFTAAGILLLEERGLLKTTDSIRKYVRQAPAAWNTVTLQHLLTHTSGIANYTDSDNFQRLKQQSLTPGELIALFKNQSLAFAPGEKFAYSNSNYILLGHVIDEVSGLPYADFLQENMFTPLGMKNSGYDSHERILERRASGYVQKQDKIRNADYIDMSVPYAAGALYSTTADLLRWQRALYDGKLLSTASLQKMTTPHKSDYGFGILIRTAEHTTYTHAGGIDGFTSFLMYCPDTRLTVVVLSNLLSKAPGDIAAKLHDAAHATPHHGAGL